MRIGLPRRGPAGAPRLSVTLPRPPSRPCRGPSLPRFSCMARRRSFLKLSPAPQPPYLACKPHAGGTAAPAGGASVEERVAASHACAARHRVSASWSGEQSSGAPRGAPSRETDRQQQRQQQQQQHQNRGVCLLSELSPIRDSRVHESSGLLVGTRLAAEATCVTEILPSHIAPCAGCAAKCALDKVKRSYQPFRVPPLCVHFAGRVPVSALWKQKPTQSGSYMPSSTHYIYSVRQPPSRIFSRPHRQP